MFVRRVSNGLHKLHAGPARMVAIIVPFRPPDKSTRETQAGKGLNLSLGDLTAAGISARVASSGVDDHRRGAKRVGVSAEGGRTK